MFGNDVTQKGTYSSMVAAEDVLSCQLRLIHASFSFRIAFQKRGTTCLSNMHLRSEIEVLGQRLLVKVDFYLLQEWQRLNYDIYTLRQIRREVRNRWRRILEDLGECERDCEMVK